MNSSRWSYATAAVFVGGSLGTMIRIWLMPLAIYLVELHGDHRLIGALLATLLANVMGCLLIGALAAAYQHRHWLWSFAGLGFCGGLTTVSGFAFDTWLTWQSQSLGAAFFYVSVTIGLCIGSAALGYVWSERRIGQSC